MASFAGAVAHKEWRERRPVACRRGHPGRRPQAALRL